MSKKPRFGVTITGTVTLTLSHQRIGRCHSSTGRP